MRTSIDCIPCFIRQTLDASRMVISDEKIIFKVMKKVMKKVANFDLTLTPPEMGQIIHKIIRSEIKNSDPYLNLKKQSTEKALELSGKIKKIILESKNPFETALRFSIAGNIMDFGMKSDWDEHYIMASFRTAEHQPLDLNTVQSLYNEISTAKTVLILGDNAGESVFDRLFIETFPSKKDIFYAVKGSAVINDVTESEAVHAGIDRVACIISNGTDIAGTLLSQCSEEFVKLFNKADVIISKGQGNFETLNTAPRKIYFLFQVKCDIIARHYNYKPGEWLVTNCDNLKEVI
ncbi:MAG: ARMT1-like domain-containing protein [Candidatus Wallbacteria bacterium]